MCSEKQFDVYGGVELPSPPIDGKGMPRHIKMRGTHGFQVTKQQQELQTMRRKCRKCRWCGKVKAVKYHNVVDGSFFCSRECMMKANRITFLASDTCARCGTPIRLNGVVQRRHMSADAFYCCEKCAMDDLGIIQDADEKED